MRSCTSILAGLQSADYAAAVALPANAIDEQSHELSAATAAESNSAAVLLLCKCLPPHIRVEHQGYEQTSSFEGPEVANHI